MSAFDRLREVGLFTDLSDDDLGRLCTDVTELHLEPGHVLFEEGDPGDRAYVITAGDLEVVKATDGREALVAVRGPGSVIGEMALLQEEPRMASVRARSSVDLLSISKTTLDQLLDSSPSAARTMFRVLIERMRETSELLRHSERMAQLGVLTAGVAHELNNPAAAVRRAAVRLQDELDTYTALVADVPTADTGLARERALALLSEHPPSSIGGGAIARADTEAAVEDLLDRRGVREAWRLAPELVESGVDADLLTRLGDDLDGDALAHAARFLVASHSIGRLANEAAEGARRLSDIVKALKGYAFLDQAPVQNVDVVEGLEDTLVLLGHKTKRWEVVRQFDPGLPKITALGSELNQVWTNLIDNACDALNEVGGDRTPTLTLRAYRAGEDVVVEVEDNGPGIPPELLDRVFDAFFTTKPPGRGTGLGLQISYRIIVLEHRGDLTVDSEPGRTTFRVLLPTTMQPPTQLSDRATDDGHVPADGHQEESTMATARCEHLESMEVGPTPDGGCQPCLELGDTWVHLRFCTTCGQVGCCDDSKNRHARRHAEATGHPVIRTKEPGEDWAWCIPDDVGMNLQR